MLEIRNLIRYLCLKSTRLKFYHLYMTPFCKIYNFKQPFYAFYLIRKGYFLAKTSHSMIPFLLYLYIDSSSSWFPVIRKEFEVPPYSQSVELGSQIQLRCHPPKGVPTPRVSVLKWYVCLLILCHLELPGREPLFNRVLQCS